MKKKPEIVTRLKKLKKRELSNPDYNLDDYEYDVSIYGEHIYSDVADKTYVEESEDVLNAENVLLGDIYMTRYNNINIFFMVSKTRLHQVALFELETKMDYAIGEENMPYETFVEGFKPRKRPYIIAKNNCWTKTDFWVKTDSGDGLLYVPTSASSPICQLDIARGRMPTYTYLKCFKIPTDKLVEEFKKLTNAPFPVDNQADWFKENEINRKDKAIA